MGTDWMNQSRKTRIAHLAGSTATIQNTPPLVTSNKARAKHGLPLLKDVDGAPLRYDSLRPQRLAAPAKVYVEQFSARPLESDVAELYGPPDGYIGVDGTFRKERQSAGDKPVYEVELKPEDGLYPLPYMATQGRRIGVGGGMHFAGRAEWTARLFGGPGGSAFGALTRYL
jgi:L-asparaginase